MDATLTSRPIDRVLERLENVIQTRTGFSARCPSHDDKRNSLHVKEGDDGRVLIHCKAGCTFEQIVHDLGLEQADLFPAKGESLPPPPPPAKKQKTKHPTCEKAIDAARWGVRRRQPDAEIEDVYEYGNDIRVVRFTTKDFAPVHRNCTVWVVGKPDIYPLYHEAEIIGTGQSYVFFTEGEKDAERLIAEGLVGTTMAGGVHGIVRNLKAADLSTLAGRDVVLLPDNDEPGRDCMHDVAKKVMSVANTVRILELPGLPPKGDVSDWLDAGGDPQDLVGLANQAPVYTPTPAKPPPEREAICKARQAKPFKPTDMGNAERYASDYGDRIRYAFDGDKTGSWFVWTGSRWQRDNAGIHKWLMGKTMRGIAAEWKAIPAEEEQLRKEMGNHAVRSESAKSINAAIDLARSQAPIATQPDKFDADPWLLNTLSGTLDLRTGEVRGHNPADLITKLCPVEYDPTATSPVYDQFINDIMLGREDLIEYIERFLGYCLTGDHRHHVLPIAFGGGANGKSTLFDLMLHIMGDYAGAAPESLLTSSTRSEHPTEIADLMGKRLVVASETGEGATLRINLIKKLTGDEKLTARFMRQDYFTFNRTHKLVLQTNNRPRIAENNNAVWRRLKLIPFDLHVPEDQQDPALPEKLKAETPGILARLVRACRRWIENDCNLAEPDVVRQQTDDYRESEDPLTEFLETVVCVTGNDADFIERPVIAGLYERWCDLRKVEPLETRSFYERIRALQGVKQAEKRVDGKKERVFRGIRPANR